MIEERYGWNKSMGEFFRNIRILFGERFVLGEWVN